MQRYFCGEVNTEKHSQIVSLEMLPRISRVTNEETGEVTEYVHGYTRNLYTGVFETRTYVFEGVSAEMAAKLPESITVTDVGGAAHVVSFKTYVHDGSSGTAVFEDDANNVTIHRMSPNLRRIEVVRRVGTLYCNGVYVLGRQF